MKNLTEAILNRKKTTNNELKNSLLEPFVHKKDYIEDGLLGVQGDKLIITLDKYSKLHQYYQIDSIDYEGIIKKLDLTEIQVEGDLNKEVSFNVYGQDLSGTKFINNTNKLIILNLAKEFPHQLVGNIKTSDTYAYYLEGGNIQKNKQYKIEDYYHPIFAETSETGKIGWTMELLIQKISSNITIPYKKLFYISVPKGYIYFIKGISDRNELKNYYYDNQKPLDYNKFKPLNEVWWYFIKD